jgi:hypothetical protein
MIYSGIEKAFMDSTVWGEVELPLVFYKRVGKRYTEFSLELM